jgi:uncharacterized protein
MQATHLFKRRHLPATAWKNGGGVTVELARWPADASLDDFDWRVSIAEVASSGPFSIFPGVDRVITLLEGEGFALRSDDGAIYHQLDVPLQPFAFVGEARIQADLLGDTSVDFNVMCRRSRCTAHIHLITNETRLPPSAHGLLFACEGRWLANKQPLTKGDGAWWHDAEQNLRLTPRSANAQLLAVQITAHDS